MKPGYILVLTEQQRNNLIVVLNCELRHTTGTAAHPLNDIFRQLVGRDHDVYAKHYPARCTPPHCLYKL
jgi:hypothetical protein